MTKKEFWTMMWCGVGMGAFVEVEPWQTLGAAMLIVVVVLA